MSSVHIEPWPASMGEPWSRSGDNDPGGCWAGPSPSGAWSSPRVLVGSSTHTGPSSPSWGSVVVAVTHPSDSWADTVESNDTSGSSPSSASGCCRGISWMMTGCGSACRKKASLKALTIRRCMSPTLTLKIGSPAMCGHTGKKTDMILRVMGSLLAIPTAERLCT